ncbi:MAG: cell envelope integrity protein TolA [Pseudomonadota bacterium]|nr:cell envelope integrity protein TolA [Pseudomonadota bacterium]
MNRHARREGSPWASWSLSILLHVGIIAIVGGFWFWSQRSKPPEPMGITGGVVTAEQLAERLQPAPQPEPVVEEPAPPEPEPEPLPEEPPPPEEDPAVLQAEAQRLAEEQRAAEARLLAEAQEAERKAVEVAAREKAERERREKERAEREKAAREKAERERVERERVARENAERERQQREEAERRRRESELAEQLASEERRDAVRGSALANQYKAQIEAKIMRAWLKPPSARPGLVCEVRVTQVPGGSVAGVQITRCNGDEAVRLSVEDAVRRASPLPAPPDPALFERELIVTFRPED